MASRASAYRPAAPASLDRRAAARRPVLVAPATVRPDGDAAVTAELQDLSAFGCRIRAPGDQSAGGRVWLTLAGASPVAATVVWVTEELAGCRFDEPIARELVRGLTLGIA